VSDPAAFAARGFGLRYDDHRVLADVDFDVAAGSVGAIVGPSGCGKTSFLHCVNRLCDLIPGTRPEGSLRWDRNEVLVPGCDLHRLRREVGMIFQHPEPFPGSIAGNVELALREHGMGDRTERRKRVERALRDAALWDEVHDRLDRDATTLSGGQQQRLCIARAIALEPRALLMDEPCGALDPLATAAIEELIARLKTRMTILIVTHNLAQARRIADTTAVFWLRAGTGTCIEQRPSAELFADPRTDEARAYLLGELG